jgi:hypothetical protein
MFVPEFPCKHPVEFGENWCRTKVKCNLRQNITKGERRDNHACVDWHDRAVLYARQRRANIGKKGKRSDRDFQRGQKRAFSRKMLLNWGKNKGKT